MKILIAGYGRVGATLARELSAEGHNLTLMDSDPRVLASGIERYDVMAVQGNCASMEALAEAGVKKSNLLIATTGSDELNLLACITAHIMNPKIHTIARIRDPEYSKQAYRMRDAMGLSMTFNPEYEAAQEIERLLKLPGFLKRDSFAGGSVEIVELRIDAESRLCGAPLNTLYGIVKCRVLVCAVLRDGEAIMPDGQFTLLEGDRMFVTAQADTLAMLLKNLGVVRHKNRRVLMIGGGTVSYYLASLLKNSSMELTIVESDPERCVELATALPRAHIIEGDAREQSILENETLSSIDAMVSLTGQDELNMLLSLYGNHCGIPQIITRVGQIEQAGIADMLPLGSMISPHRLCCNNIVRYVRAMKKQEGAAVAIHSIADGRAEAMEFRVDSRTRHCGKPLKSLKLKKNLLLVSISGEDGVAEIPSGDSTFCEGDSVVVVASNELGIRQLNDIFA